MDIEKLIQLEPRFQAFEKNVTFKYQIFNSLFLGLPFKDLNQSGSRLPIFNNYCEEMLVKGLHPLEIVETYLKDVNLPFTNQMDLLFTFLQFIERQVVLFDALEDAAFSEVNDLSGIGSLDYLLNQIANEDIDKSSKFEELLKIYKVRLVLTAHPTQFYPKSILGIIANMGKAIKDNNIDDIRNLFLQLGLTRFTNKTKPTPIDEARSLIWYLENIFYNDLLHIQKKLATDTINLELGFWPGGDRDGNPFVTHKVTLDVANKLRISLAKLYYKDIQTLRSRLTFDGVYSRLTEIASKVKFAEYKAASEFIVDLESIINVLKEKYQGLFVSLVNELIIKVKMFGFYFAKIDMRQNSKIHKQAITILFKTAKLEDDYAKLNDLAKVELLKNNLTNIALLDNLTDETVAELIASIKAIHSVQETNGINAIERYIISNSDSLASIFEVFFLIQLVNNYLLLVHKAVNLIKIEIVPLFETIDDLDNAPQIMEFLYQEPIYLQHLTKHDFTQTIMLGFSDGTKDGGYLRANWSIYQAKKNLTAISRKYNINVIFFDGRGGPPSRGGGNSYDFYRALGSDIEARQVQLTVQGQTISSNFGTIDSAMYHVEKLVSSGLAGRLFYSASNNLNSNQEELIEKLAGLSYKFYLALRNDPLFLLYLEQITPLKYLAEINIGSRPAKRNQDSALRFEDLRAIPFVSSWMQMKQNILGFYGIGSAIKSLLDDNLGYKDQLKALYINSLFFRTLLNNAMQSIYQSDFIITAYLAGDEMFGEFWLKLKNEADLSQQLLLEISGGQPLFGLDYIKLESIKLRKKIILPLLVIQQYALTKLRHGEHENKEILEKLIKKCLAPNVNASRNAI